MYISMIDLRYPAAAPARATCSVTELSGPDLNIGVRRARHLPATVAGVDTHGASLMWHCGRTAARLCLGGGGGGFLCGGFLCGGCGGAGLAALSRLLELLLLLPLPRRLLVRLLLLLSLHLLLLLLRFMRLVRCMNRKLFPLPALMLLYRCGWLLPWSQVAAAAAALALLKIGYLESPALGPCQRRVQRVELRSAARALAARCTPAQQHRRAHAPKSGRESQSPPEFQSPRRSGLPRRGRHPHERRCAHLRW
jgi:hypothetical protein